MVDLRILTDDGLLHLDEVADVVVAREFGARTKPRVRADARVPADRGAFKVTEGKDFDVILDRRIANHAVGAHANAVAEHDAALEHAADVDLDVLSADKLAANVDAVGINERHAGFKQAVGLHALPGTLKGGELHLGVDALDFIGMVRMNGGDAHAVGGREAHEIREVVLLLGVVVLQGVEPGVKTGRREHHDAGVDLPDQALLVGRILFLDDGRYDALGVSHDAAVALRIVHFNGEENELALLRLLEHAAGRFSGQKRHVSEADKRLGFVSVEHGPGLHQCMPRSLLRHLKRELQVGPAFVVLLHLLRAMTDDNRLDGGKALHGIKHVIEHRSACERLENLGQFGMHALAHAGGKNDDVHGYAWSWNA